MVTVNGGDCVQHCVRRQWSLRSAAADRVCGGHNLPDTFNESATMLRRTKMKNVWGAIQGSCIAYMIRLCSFTYDVCCIGCVVSLRLYQVVWAYCFRRSLCNTISVLFRPLGKNGLLSMSFSMAASASVHLNHLAPCTSSFLINLFV